MRFFSIAMAAKLLDTTDTTLIKLVRTHPELLADGLARIERGGYIVDAHEISKRFKQFKQNPLGAAPRGPKPKPQIHPRKKKRKGLTATGAPEEAQREALSGVEEAEQTIEYATSRAKRELWAAKKAKMEYLVESGKLIPLADVLKEFTDVATATQKAVMSVPDRMAPLLVGEEDQAVIHKRLSDEIRYALKNLSFKLAGQGDKPKREETDA